MEQEQHDDLIRAAKYFNVLAMAQDCGFVDVETSIDTTTAAKLATACYLAANIAGRAIAEAAE